MLNSHPCRTGLLGGLVVALLGMAGLGWTATASAAPGSPALPPAGGTISSGAPSVGFTVSWLPTTSPVQAIPGQTATGTFWVTNQTAEAIPVDILPATAVPGDNGSLGVREGADQRFPSIVYSPNSFVAQSKTTTPVSVTVTTPSNLAPGIYLIPAVVRPSPPRTGGNIQIQQETDALVTFQVPGVTNAHVKPTFVGVDLIPAATSHHLPGLPTIQIGTSGGEVLRVLDDSPSSLYAYNEIAGTQKPFGEVVFKGHTAGDPHDLRSDQALYFPDRYRDYPIVWHPSTVGIGAGHLTAYVYFHPNPNVLTQMDTSIEVLVISPLWVLVVIALLAVLLLWASRRTRELARSGDAEPRRRGVASRVGQVVGSLVVVLVIVVGAFLSSPPVFFIVGGAGVVLAGLLFVACRRCAPPVAARRIRLYEGVAGVVLVAAVAAVLLSVLSSWSADVAVGVAAGAGVWTLAAWWALWWNEERPVTELSLPDGPDATENDGNLVSAGI